MICVKALVLHSVTGT